MSKTVVWAWCVTLALLINRLFDLTGMLNVHVPPEALIGLVVAGFAALRAVTSKPLSRKQKVASWVLTALAGVGSILVYVIPAPPVPVSVPDLPAAVSTTPAPQADVVPLVPAAPVEAVAPTTSTSEVLESVTTPPMAADVDAMALLPLCLIPVFASRQGRRAIVAVILALAIVGCCGAQTEADTLWLKDTTCWEYMQLTQGAKTDPLGKQLTQEQVDRRVKLLQERMARKGMTCEGATF